jgi:hypothetical protein
VALSRWFDVLCTDEQETWVRGGCPYGDGTDKNSFGNDESPWITCAMSHAIGHYDRGNRKLNWALEEAISSDYLAFIRPKHDYKRGKGLYAEDEDDD